jgi:O-antigen/teichoic acid export membrane protein
MSRRQAYWVLCRYQIVGLLAFLLIVVSFHVVLARFPDHFPRFGPDGYLVAVAGAASVGSALASFWSRRVTTRHWRFSFLILGALTVVSCAIWTGMAVFVGLVAYILAGGMLR